MSRRETAIDLITGEIETCEKELAGLDIEARHLSEQLDGLNEQLKNALRWRQSLKDVLEFLQEYGYTPEAEAMVSVMSGESKYSEAVRAHAERQPYVYKSHMPLPNAVGSSY